MIERPLIPLLYGALSLSVPFPRNMYESSLNLGFKISKSRRPVNKCCRSVHDWNIGEHARIIDAQ